MRDLLFRGILTLSLPCLADFQGATHLTPFDEDTIAYSKSQATGPVARLKERLGKGEV